MLLVPRRPAVAGLLLTALGVLLLQPAALGQEAPSTDTVSGPLEEALRDNSHPLRVRDGSLRGRGGAWLREQAKDATFIALGEVHGTQEIPAIMGALLNDLQAAGEVDHLALEVSPWTADLMTDSLRAPDSSFTSFVKRRPATIPFYTRQPERDLIRNFVRQSTAEHPLWGLDQIFAFATDLTLDRLADLAPTAEARRRVAKVRASARSDSTTDPALTQLPPSMPTPLTVLPRTVFDTLDASFQGVQEAQRLLDELAISTEIYRLNDTDNYRANQIRARYLRQNLHRQYERAEASSEAPPQVAIKVGGRHAYRDRTPNNALDVGNLAVALAERSGGTAFNVMVVCGPNSTSRDYPAGTTDCWSEHWSAFTPALGDGPTLFDLTAIHPLLHQGVLDPSPRLERMLWGFDAVVIVPNAQPSFLIAPIIENERAADLIVRWVGSHPLLRHQPRRSPQNIDRDPTLQ
jgi:hypothetical protein